LLNNEEEITVKKIYIPKIFTTKKERVLEV